MEEKTYTAGDRSPFTYTIHCAIEGVNYYGVRFCRKCHPSDLGVTYFSSSNIIKSMIRRHGLEHFTFKVRRVFSSIADAVSWETKVLRRLDVKNSPKWLNRHNGDGKFINKGGYKLSEATKMRMRKPKSVAHKQALSDNHADVSGANHPRFGKKFGPHSTEMKAKISAARKGITLGRKLSEETKLKKKLTLAKNRALGITCRSQRRNLLTRAGVSACPVGCCRWSISPRAPTCFSHDAE